MPTRLENKENWAINSGLMPMHLAPHNVGERYIMLDGGYYEFCLDLDKEAKSEEDYNSFAWSSDVKNYIRVELSAKDANPEFDNQLINVKLGEMTHDKESLKCVLI